MLPRDGPATCQPKRTPLPRMRRWIGFLYGFGKSFVREPLPVQSIRQLEQDKSAVERTSSYTRDEFLSSQNCESNCRFPHPDTWPTPQYRGCVRSKPDRNWDASYVLIWAVPFPRFFSPDLRIVWGHNNVEAFTPSELLPLYRCSWLAVWHQRGYFKRVPLSRWKRDRMCFVCLPRL
jgi:hypothetical protein